MKKELTYATVCSGIECMSVACIGLPMRPVFFSEIEPFPCAVLKAHYPDIPNLGDMSKIQVSENGLEITNGATSIRLHERLGILAGGTPCQDVSVAGKRAGMQEGSGTRSSLAFDFVRLARELRPRWVLWENVAGSIDSKNAPDFLRFASALGDCGYSLAWRVLDAQFVRVDGMERAVPQRRRRVWVVGCLGADESVPAQILFEPDCAQGHTPPRRRAGQGFAYSLAGRDRVDAGVVGGAPTRATGGGGRSDVSESLTARSYKGIGARNGEISGAFAAIALDGDKLKPREDQRKGGNGFGVNEEGAGYTLTAVDRHGVAHESQCYENYANSGDVAETIDANYYKGQGSRQGVERPVAVQCFSKVSHPSAPNGEGERWDEREVSPTLSHQPSALEPTVAQSGVQCLTPSHPQTHRVYSEQGAFPSLCHNGGEAGQNQQAVLASLSQMRYIVRRLTPKEAERLMGLPDGYTIPAGLDANDPALVAEFQRIHDTFGAIMAEYEHAKPPKPKTAAQVQKWLAKITDPATCPDSPRYKACGNGWATNQPRWILTRLLALGECIDPFTGEEL